MLNLRHLPLAARRLATPVAIGVAAAIAAACANNATRNTGPLRLSVEDTGQLFAISGVPGYYPAGINLTSRNVVVVTVFADGTVPFDVAFDLTPSGQVKVMPPRTVALGPNVVPISLNIFKPGKPWAQVTEAPLAGYTPDTIQVVGANEPVVLEYRSLSCSFSILSSQYAKFVVDSVNVPGRRIYFRLLVNPNCGRRSLVANKS